MTTVYWFCQSSFVSIVCGPSLAVVAGLEQSSTNIIAKLDQAPPLPVDRLTRRWFRCHTAFIVQEVFEVRGPESGVASDETGPCWHMLSLAFRTFEL